MLFRHTLTLFFLVLLIPNQIYAYDNLPPEKRLQICCELRDALNPSSSHHQAHWWTASKIIIASFAGAGTVYTATKLDAPPEATPQANKNRDKLLKIQAAIYHLRKNLGANPPPIAGPSDAPNPLPQAPMSFTKGQVFTFAATTAASYVILSLFFDKKIMSPSATLKAFLINWPDYSMHAPQILCREARPLYAGYLRQGDAIIADKKTAELIILAFTVFLTAEIELITQSLC